ncbi:ABC transporter permease [Bacillus sp. FJAT-44742]|uniref:ABC transporter permease n=1 Tax=Bacillus sp. FJAT-44742 TaxID=2014005 RepID=UPI000C245DC3|nr:ABC transporter permease [Bacillus sp. FJAT-44742]
MTIFTFVFKRFFRKRSNLLFLLILPVGVMFLPEGEWPPIPLGFQYYGILLMFIAAKLAGIIMQDRYDKALLRLSIAPITHFQYLLQNLLAYFLILTLVNIAAVLTGVIVHGNNIPSPVLLFIIYSFFTLTALGFALAWISLFHNKETAFAVVSGVIVLMAMTGGVMWPVELMPEVLQRVVMVIPTYWLAEAMRVVSFDVPVEELAVPLVMMLLFSAAFLLLGSRRRIS